jgi:hypothetical protein
MLSGLKRLWPSGAMGRKIIFGACMLGVGVGAFCYGRWGGVSEATAQQPGAPAEGALVPQNLVRTASNTDYGRRVVAYIYDTIPVTREDLGEYLIARVGAERLEFLVNRKIVELACQSKGIYVTDAEIEAQFQIDLKGFGPNITEKDFVNVILKRFNKTLFEWKEDVIRPKLLLSKYCRHRIKIEESDITKAFEAKYGPKVQCRMIVFEKGSEGKVRSEIYEKIRSSEDEFRKYAREQFVTALAAKGGEVPPIHKHFGDANIEKEAFSLKPGDISTLLGMPDGTSIILKCDKEIPADNTRRMAEERPKLIAELTELKLNMEIPKAFKELRDAARPNFLGRHQVRQDELERQVQRELTPASATAPKVAPPPPLPGN